MRAGHEDIGPGGLVTCGGCQALAAALKLAAFEDSRDAMLSAGLASVCAARLADSGPADDAPSAWEGCPRPPAHAALAIMRRITEEGSGAAATINDSARTRTRLRRRLTSLASAGGDVGADAAALAATLSLPVPVSAAAAAPANAASPESGSVGPAPCAAQPLGPAWGASARLPPTPTGPVADAVKASLEAAFAASFTRFGPGMLPLSNRDSPILGRKEMRIGGGQPERDVRCAACGDAKQERYVTLKGAATPPLTQTGGPPQQAAPSKLQLECFDCLARAAQAAGTQPAAVPAFISARCLSSVDARDALFYQNHPGYL